MSILLEFARLERSTLRLHRRLELDDACACTVEGTTIFLAAGSSIEQGVRLTLAGGSLRLASLARIGEGATLLLGSVMDVQSAVEIEESVLLEAEVGGLVLGEAVRVGRFSRLWAHRGPIAVGPRSAIGHFNTWIGTGQGIQVAEACDFTHQVTLDSAGGRIEMGPRSGVGPGSILYGHGGLRIGADCAIAGLTMIVPGNHRVDRLDRPIREQGVEGLPIEIGDDVWIGGGAVVLGGASIGDGAVIGAGAVVRGRIDPEAIVAGVPARPIGSRMERQAREERREDLPR